MTIAQWIITSGGAVGSLGMIFQTIIKPVFRWGKRLDKAVTSVEMNMKNNGGSSLRDAVDRIENRITKLEDYVTKPR